MKSNEKKPIFRPCSESSKITKKCNGRKWTEEILDRRGASIDGDGPGGVQQRRSGLSASDEQHPITLTPDNEVHTVPNVITEFLGVLSALLTADINGGLSPMRQTKG